MSVKVEKLEHNMVKLTIEVEASVFDKAYKAAFQKQKNQFSVPGFRKGKVPQAYIEKMYGPEVFYDEAVNSVMNDTYGPALEEADINPVSRPEANVISVGKGQNMVYEVVTAVKPEVTLGAYKGVEVTELPTDVTEEEVANAIENELKKNARKTTITDRAVADGDTIKLDFAGCVDGVAFDGGTAEDYTLKIGSGSFIPGFEEQLIGVMPGEDKQVEVTFPEDYHSADLAGKAAAFACTVKSIDVEEIPELNDEFVDEISEYDNVEAYKESVKADLAAKKAEANKNTQLQEAIDKIIGAAEMDIPEAMIMSQAENMLEEFKQQIASYGMNIDDYFKYANTDAKGMMEQMKPDALVRIQNDLVLEAIIKAEGLEVEEAVVDAEYGKMADMYGMPVEQVKAALPADMIKTDLLMKAARDFVADNMAVVAAPAEEQ